VGVAPGSRLEKAYLSPKLKAQLLGNEVGEGYSSYGAIHVLCGNVSRYFMVNDKLDKGRERQLSL